MTKVFMLSTVGLLWNCIYNTNSIGAENNSLDIVVDNYLTSVTKSVKTADPAEKQASYDKAKTDAKTLLGVVDGVKLTCYSRMKVFCDLLQSRKKALAAKSVLSNKKEELKRQRDVHNYEAIIEFLKCISRLLDAMYADQKLVDMIIEKMPDEVPVLAMEITTMLRVLRIIIANPNDIQKSVETMVEFACFPEDGARLMSKLTSLAISDPEKADFKQLLNEMNQDDIDQHKYLHIR
jgi:hypothetical protein